MLSSLQPRRQTRMTSIALKSFVKFARQEFERTSSLAIQNMSTRKPRRLSLPRSRVLVSDLLCFARTVPTCAHERVFQLDGLNALRTNAGQRIAWPLIFIRAYTLATEKHPVLRQCHMKWPWPHLYEHPHHVATLAIVREHQGQPWLFFGNFNQPEDRSLVDLQRQLDGYKTDPVEKAFAHQLRASKVPMPLRRALWWARINFLGKKRAKRLGTFGLTTISSRGAVIPDPPGLLTSTMSYGPIDEKGQCRVSISYDHRLMDGWFIAELLEQIEQTMKTTITDELRSIQSFERPTITDAA